MRARFEEVDSMLLPCLPENADILSDMYEKVPQAAGISTYLAKMHYIRYIRTRM